MALNLSDPGAIVAAYESIVDNTLNWLLLKYSNAQHDELSLFETGSDGLWELKQMIDELDQVFIGFYRHELSLGEEPIFTLINYIPNTVSGVKRARALVHSRRVGAVFKRHHTTLTVEHLNHLSSEAIRSSLDGLDHPKYPSMGRTTSQPNQAPLAPIRRSFSETYAPYAIPPAPPVAKSASMFSSFMRRKKKADDSNDEDDDADPPPAPPKDKGKYGIQRTTVPYDNAVDISGPRVIPPRKRNGSVSDFAVISRSSSSDEVIIEPVRSEKPIIQTLPLRGKWTPKVIDPEERLRRTREAQRQRLIEEQEALREEEERQAERNRQREAQIREEKEYEARRRASLEEEVRRMTAERKRKERLEKEEEEQKTREFEERKRLDRERRLLEHQKLEAWRQEQVRLADEAARRAEESRQREEDERRKKISIAEAKVKRKGAESLLTGWVTIQASGSLLWKRRYFKFIGSTAYFYRSPTDTHQILEKVELRGKLRGLREWNEGYEDLEAIPHSFAVEFKDGQKWWSMYADSEEEKYKLLGLLHHAAGL
ncbi:hypothetical protein BDZ94DRAFT_1326449 [Collybia nuda]|uniref:ADF-H domain-containing protein n=1 Tax=Collybia nuda TaxID=64659 RepID=A0A9P5XX53_9AGAR|nr:hypothetical protein BDZ94DRAFT_1326449 [Collybia nuda]